MLKKVHLIVGFLFLVLFLATGAYMHLNFPELYGGREEVRMMYRATHIYILFAASVNLLVAHCLNNFANNLARIQLLASMLLLLAPVLIFIGFMVEPPLYLIERPVSFWGVVSLFAGVVLISVLNLSWIKKHATSQ